MFWAMSSCCLDFRIAFVIIFDPGLAFVKDTELLIAFSAPVSLKASEFPRTDVGIRAGEADVEEEGVAELDANATAWARLTNSGLCRTSLLCPGSVLFFVGVTLQFNDRALESDDHTCEVVGTSSLLDNFLKFDN